MAEKRKKNISKEWKKRNRQIFVIISIMVGLIVLLLLISWLAQRNNTFTYQSLTFTKEKFGEIPVYHYYYNFEDSGQKYKYNLYLREDPRKSNIPVEGQIVYSRESTVYISVNTTGLTECSDSSMAIGSLSAFLTNNFIPVKGAVPDEREANRTKVVYATCETHPENVVIMVKKANETRITKKGNCHVIDVANCDVLKAVERFEIQSVADAKNRV